MANSPFKTQWLRDDTLLVNPGTMLDADNAPEMVELISNTAQEPNRFVILDMRELEFISSAGVGSILGTVEMLRQNGGDIILCNMSPTIEHVFRVLDLLEYLSVRSTRDEALTACHS